MGIWEMSPENLQTILGEFAKLRTVSVLSTLSAFLIAKARNSLGKLWWPWIFEYFSEICGEKSNSFWNSTNKSEILLKAYLHLSQYLVIFS